MQRWVQFCLCWCLEWLHRVHGVCTHLNWAHNLTIRTLKPPFLVCFGTYTDSLASHTQPDRIARVPLLCFTAEKVEIPSCAQQCWAVSPLHLSNNTPLSGVCRSPGAPRLYSQAFCRSRIVSESFVHSVYHAGGAWQTKLVLVKLVMTQRCEWVQGLGCGCCSCLHLMPCIVLVLAAEWRHQSGELTL